MRKIDKLKPVTGKAAKTINFDKIVLALLEDKVKRENSNVSTFVNFIIRGIVMGDEKFYEEMRKYYALKTNECDYMIDRIKAKKEVK